MEQITLEYQPLPFLKYTRKIKGAFPQTLEELNQKQLIVISSLVNQKISETNFLHIMTGIRKFRINKLDNYQRYQLMQLFEPFTEIQPFDRFIIPVINTGTGSFVSPKPKLAQMTFAQFIFIESYFEDYQNKKQQDLLLKFIASLYTPVAESFNENNVQANVSRIKLANPQVLDAIVINYVFIKEWLALAYPLVFGVPETENEPQKNKPLRNNNSNSAWLKIFENIVGDDLVNQDRYAIIPLHNVLRWMTNKIKENMKRK